jgi:hypothetical protein
VVPGGTGTGSTGTGDTGTGTGTGSGTGQCTSDAECGPGAVCDISNDECGSLHCVACSSSSGPVCDAQGHTYASECAALQAGQRLGLPCVPAGSVLCNGNPPRVCDLSTEVCVPGFETDCGGFSPAFCMPAEGGPDGGAGDGG